MLRGLFLTILLCAGLAIAGCGGGDDATSTDGGGETTSASAPAESTETKPTVEVPSGPPPKQLETEEQHWKTVTSAVGKVLRLA